VSEVRGMGAYSVARGGGGGQEDGAGQESQAREERIEPRLLPGAA
jgi:hypothetical protein